MMFAKGIKINIPLNDHLFIVFSEKGVVNNLCRILLIALGQKSEGLSYPVGCLYKTFTIRIFAQSFQDMADLLFHVCWCSVLIRNLQLIRQRRSKSLGIPKKLTFT